MLALSIKGIGIMALPCRKTTPGEKAAVAQGLCKRHIAAGFGQTGGVAAFGQCKHGERNRVWRSDLTALPLRSSQAGRKPDRMPAHEGDRYVVAKPDSTRRLGLMAEALPLLLCGQTTARHWAEPVDLAGVPNLHRVTPLIYRSAPPSAEGFHNLAKIGVKTVINLRRTVDDSPLAVGTGLALIHINTTRHVTDGNGAKIVLALRALRDAQSPGPVLLHCTRGADRTGIIAALWRMLYQGWSRDQALEECDRAALAFTPSGSTFRNICGILI